jgi:hypothetical protein
MITLTKPQRRALKRKFDDNPDGSKTYREFRKRVVPGGFGSDSYIMIQWCGMWLGIEVDGYTHS